MKQRVLLIDPYTALTRLLVTFLNDEGYEVAEAQSLEEASVLMVGSRFDLIITEAFDQGKNLDLDPAFLGRLRTMAGNTPIILCSTYVPRSSIEREKMGLAEIVPKPFDLDDLVGKVRRTLGK